MSTTPDLSSTPDSNSVVPDASTPTPGDSTGDIPAQVRELVSSIKHFSTKSIEEFVKPPFKTFLETWDINPQLATIVASPALLLFLLVAAFFVISILCLVLWSILAISLGVAFVILSGLVSLFFKLFIVLIATIPLAGIATGLLAAANAISKFIIKKISPEGMSSGVIRAVKDADWKQIAESTMTVGGRVVQLGKDAWPIFLTIRDILVTLGLALHSALETTLSALHDSADTESPSHPSTTLNISQPVPTSEGIVHGSAKPTSEPIIETEISEATEPINISNQPESSARVLKKRTPFIDPGDDETELRA